MRLQAQNENIPFSLTDEDHVSVFEDGTLPGGPVLQLNECGWGDASGTNDRYGLTADLRCRCSPKKLGRGPERLLS
jgi:hypothetical protein